MIVLYPVVLGIAVVVVRRARERGAAPRSGPAWFGAWTAAGALFTFSFLTGFSIGLFVLPLAAAALFWVARRAPSSEAIGFVGGIGATLVLVAFVNRDYTPCPPGGLRIPAAAPAGTSVSCSGFAPWPWLLAGVIVTASSLLAYAITRRR